jgi:hypothetical protein
MHHVSKVCCIITNLILYYNIITYILVPTVKKSFILYSHVSSAFCVICTQVTDTQKLETIRCKEQPLPYPYPTHVQHLLHSLLCKHQNDIRLIQTTALHQNCCDFLFTVACNIIAMNILTQSEICERKILFIFNSKFNYPIYRNVTLDVIQSGFIPSYNLKFMFSKSQF